MINTYKNEKIVSLKRSGLLNTYFSKKDDERLKKTITFFIFALGMFRFIYLVKIKQINPVPYILQLMNHEHGRQFLLQYRNLMV